MYRGKYLKILNFLAAEAVSPPVPLSHFCKYKVSFMWVDHTQRPAHHNSTFCLAACFATMSLRSSFWIALIFSLTCSSYLVHHYHNVNSYRGGTSKIKKNILASYGTGVQSLNREHFENHPVCPQLTWRELPLVLCGEAVLFLEVIL